jgi:hypothetical protein
MSFSVMQSWRLGWESWKQHLGLATGVYLTYLILLAIPSLFALIVPHYPFGAGLLVSIIKFLISVFAFMGWVTVNLKMTGTLSVKWADFFSSSDAFPRFIGGSLLYTFAVFIGIMVMLLPLVWVSSRIDHPDIASPHHWGAGLFFLIGVLILFYLLITFSFWPFFILDKDLSVLGAFEESKKATKGCKIRLFWLFFLCMLLDLLGVLCFVVGLLITVPLTALVWTQTYKQLSMSS